LTITVGCPASRAPHRLLPNLPNASASHPIPDRHQTERCACPVISAGLGNAKVVENALEASPPARASQSSIGMGAGPGHLRRIERGSVMSGSPPIASVPVTTSRCGARPRVRDLANRNPEGFKEAIRRFLQFAIATLRIG